MKIEIISGSPRTQSVTIRVAKHLLEKFKLHKGLEVGFLDIRDYKLPFIQKVWTSSDKVPAEYKELGDRIFNADGFILVSPEYNGSYSPALKNLLDHFPKQKHKVFGIATASDGALGGMRAAQQLINTVAAFFGILSPVLLITPRVDVKFDANGKLLEDDFHKAVDNFIDEYIWLLHKINK